MWGSGGRESESESSGEVDSSKGEDPRGMERSSEMDLCLRIGFLPKALTKSRRSSVEATLGGGTGSAAVCKGP